MSESFKSVNENPPLRRSKAKFPSKRRKASQSTSRARYHAIVERENVGYKASLPTNPYWIPIPSPSLVHPASASRLCLWCKRQKQRLPPYPEQRLFPSLLAVPHTRARFRFRFRLPEPQRTSYKSSGSGCKINGLCFSFILASEHWSGNATNNFPAGDTEYPEKITQGQVHCLHGHYLDLSTPKV